MENISLQNTIHSLYCFVVFLNENRVSHLYGFVVINNIFDHGLQISVLDTVL